MTTSGAARREGSPGNSPAALLAIKVAGLTFQNPILLAAGTAAYGRELAGLIALDTLGGLVTKSVSIRPRVGAPAPRVTDFAGGMLNAVGLANPGLEAVRRDELPWLAEHLTNARVLINVVGDSVGEFAQVVRGLDDSPGVDGFELNVSCPNVKAGGMEFGADAQCLRELVAGARAATERPIFVKLSPTLQDIVASARVAADAGADGFTLVNTLPGLSIDVHRRRPVLGFGSGGVSGPALLPVGVLATWKVTRALSLPVIGVGGVSRWEDAAQYLLAGASLVGIGTAALRDPRVPQRVVRGMLEWCRSEGVDSITNLVGALEWPE